MITPFPIPDPVVTALLEQMVNAAEKLAGGSLASLHQREHLPSLSRSMSEALTETCFALQSHLGGAGAYVQRVPNVRIHKPDDPTSVVPFHSDVLYGHSSQEVNFWVNLTPVFETNSLWMTSPTRTEILHRALREQNLELEEFQTLAREHAQPLYAPAPAVHSFCCAQIHGSLLNRTQSTRVSIDLRVLPEGAESGVKKRGGYFRALWLDATGCPLVPGTPATTVASLDEATPVYLQRLAMQEFYAQNAHLELVEFHGLNHAPHLNRSLQKGPVIAYSVRQLRGLPQLSHPIGFVDEGLWFSPGQEAELERLLKELKIHI